ncbi:MAG: hypothetical protein WA364_05435 [Candidatus Nitrosopolaris sp.]
MKQTFRRNEYEDELAAKTKRQVDNAVSWLEKRYFTDEVRAKKQLSESVTHVVKANRNDKITSR